MEPTMNANVTTANVTTAQIEAFRSEALNAGDKRAAKRAEQALEGDAAALAEVSDIIARDADNQDW
jgi:hypothetical protein